MFHHTHTCPCPHLCPCHPGASTAQPGLWSDPTVTAPLSQAPKIFVHVSPAAVIQQPQEPPVPGAAPATSGPSQGTALPGATWDSPSQGTEQPRCQLWEHHPWHSQSRGSLPASFPEPSSRNGPSSPAATRAAGGSSRDQGHPIPRQRQLHSLGSGRKLSCKLEKHQLISGGNNSLSTGDKDSDLYMWCFVFFQPE